MFISRLAAERLPTSMTRVKTVISRVPEAEFDRHITAFDEARFIQAFAERRNNTCAQLRHTGVDKSRYWRHRLLRPYREWPRDRRAAEKRDELAPPLVE